MHGYPIAIPYSEATTVVAQLLEGEPGASGVLGWNVGQVFVMFVALWAGLAMLGFFIRRAS